MTRHLKLTIVDNSSASGNAHAVSMADSSSRENLREETREFVHVESHEAPREDLRQDALHALLTTFYEKVALDEFLAPYFAVVDMEHHMPRIVAFWETLVFDAGTYSGNAFRPHATMPGLTAEHFAHWLATMEQTIDSAFQGPRAERMKFMAHRVAWSMQLRLGISPVNRYKEQAVAGSE